MRILKNTIAIGLVLLILPMLFMPTAAANVTYTYTGKDFTAVSGGFTTADSVSATMTLSNPLGDSFNGDITPLSLSMSTRLFTLTSPGTLAVPDYFMTDATGRIVSWSIGLIEATSTTVVNVYTFDYAELGMAQDFADCSPPRCPTGGLATTESPGAWTNPGASVPEPATGAILATGLIALFAMRRRNKPTAARRGI
ncbi:MAG: PEP-CTERM sorting domain-containing protein [Steroidobacteraceae bacterium]